MVETTAICRFCHATCGLKVTIEQGRVVDIIGDIDNPVYHGYSCVKGRNFHEFHYDPNRVLHPLRRDATGRLQPVSLDAALTGIAADLQRILAQHGPRSVAMYGGTFSHFCSAGVMLRDAFMDAIGSPMRFSNATIDQPGKPISMALHGRWGAGPQAFADADVCLLVGANPLVSMWGGIPTFNPAKRLHEARARGLRLIVIDPRVTETARKADLHLQCLPGHDVELLAAMLSVIFAEGLHDGGFVAAETQGFEALRSAVAPFTPERVAPLAGVPATQIAEAARTFARARRGNATSGTGPSMAPYGVLMDYLVLALNTVCGRWVRAGEPMPNRGVLFRQFSGIARAEKPRPGVGLGQTLRIRGLTETAAGLPTAALADEILAPGRRPGARTDRRRRQPAAVLAQPGQDPPRARVARPARRRRSAGFGDGSSCALRHRSAVRAGRARDVVRQRRHHDVRTVDRLPGALRTVPAALDRAARRIGGACRLARLLRTRATHGTAARLSRPAFRHGRTLRPPRS